MFLGDHGFHSPRLRIPCSSLTSTPPRFPIISLLALFLSCSLTLPFLSVFCLPFTPLCPSFPCTAIAWCLAQPLTLPCPLPSQICSACVRCKSCGATPGKNWDVEWSGDYSLCPRCTQLYEKGGDLARALGPGGPLGSGRVPTQLEQMLSSSGFPPF